VALAAVSEDYDEPEERQEGAGSEDHEAEIKIKRQGEAPRGILDREKEQGNGQVQE
jgi:hypothetical protein